MEVFKVVCQNCGSEKVIVKAFEADANESHDILSILVEVRCENCGSAEAIRNQLVRIPYDLII